MKKNIFVAVCASAALTLAACSGGQSAAIDDNTTDITQGTESESTNDLSGTDAAQTTAAEALDGLSVSGGAVIDVSDVGSCKDVLDFTWDNSSKAFPVYGGYGDTLVESQAGSIAVTETDFLIYNLLIPESIIANITDAASYIHMMNANTFTGAAISVDGVSAEDAAAAIKESFLTTQYMCGFPDKIYICIFDDYVVYAFGKEEQVDEFKTAAENITGAVCYSEQYLE